MAEVETAEEFPKVHVDMINKTDEEKRKTRYRGRWKKRKWEEGGNRAEEENSAAKLVCSEPFERIKKKMVAILLGYSGVDYYGMQRNRGLNTIEEELANAFLKTNYIGEDAFEQLQSVNFQRACRTDKGVSAIRQVISLKMPNEVDIEKINKELPPQIKVFGIKRVTKGFNSKTNCDARTYTYLLPTYAFENHDVTVVDFRAFRIQHSVIDKVNQVLKHYLGTKNFHNFTSKKTFIDPSSKRFIINMECGTPFVSNGMEFCVISVKGQSFMLHQIRKMIGVVIAILRGLANEDIISSACSSKNYRLPMAPGLGLMLEQVHYDRYDKRFGNDGIHSTLVWEELNDEIEAFKEKFIYPTIVNTEVEYLPMADWLATLRFFKFQPEEEKVDDEENMQKKEDVDEEPKIDEIITKSDDNVTECLESSAKSV